MISSGFFLDNAHMREIGAVPSDVRERLAEFHLAELKKAVSHARCHTRFYRDHFRVLPETEMSGLADFKNLPFTFPNDLQEAGKSFLGVSQDEIRRIVTLTTSGTTAAPKRIFFTESDLEETISFFAEVLSCLMSPGDRGLILLPGQTPASAGDLLRAAMERIKTIPVLHGPVSDPVRALAVFKKTQPSVIIGMPVQVLNLGRRIARDKVSACIRHVILTSDYLSPKVREQIKTLLGCRVFDHYGMTETGFGGAIDCFAHQGYHLRETSLHFEIVDPETGASMPDGEWGEITVTTLKRQGMPLIRYRTGDISRVMTDPCPCGSPFRRIDYIRHRYHNTVVLPSGIRMGMPDLDDLFFSCPDVVDYEAVLIKQEKSWRLEAVLKTREYPDSAPEALEIFPERSLAVSPVVEQAVKNGDIHICINRLEAYQAEDTYVGKRQIKTCWTSEPSPVSNPREVWHEIF